MIHEIFQVVDSMTADDTLSSSAFRISSTSFLIECCFHSFLLTHAVADATALLHYCLVLDGVVPQSRLAAVWHLVCTCCFYVYVYLGCHFSRDDYLGIFRFLDFNRLPAKLAMNFVVPSISSMYIFLPAFWPSSVQSLVLSACEALFRAEYERKWQNLAKIGFFTILAALVSLWLGMQRLCA